MHARATPLVITPKDLAILRAINICRFMTAKQVVRLKFSPGSLTYGRSRLARLSGADHQPGALLFRFRAPSGSQGNSQRIYTLGSRGRDLLVSEGIPVEWYFRPYKVRTLSYGHLRHCLRLTDFYVAGKSWARRQPDVALRECRLSYELSRIPDLRVIPDAWMLFETGGKKFAI
jgi:hypothetical protein